jgi:hypothetical protein
MTMWRVKADFPNGMPSQDFGIVNDEERDILLDELRAMGAKVTQTKIPGF